MITRFRSNGLARLAKLMLVVALVAIPFTEVLRAQNVKVLKPSPAPPIPVVYRVVRPAPVSALSVQQARVLRPQPGVRQTLGGIPVGGGGAGGQGGSGTGYGVLLPRVQVAGGLNGSGQNGGISGVTRPRPTQAVQEIPRSFFSAAGVN